MQTFRGRVVLRGDNVKDDTCGNAVFTEQGASVSHMTAAKVLRTICPLPHMSDEANDAVSAYTQVQTSDAPSTSLLSAQMFQASGDGMPDCLE